MSRDTTVLPFRQREAIDHPLSELAREGARRMLAQVLIAEAHSFVAMWKDLKLPDGRDRVVRHGYGPHRAIQTGVGPVEVRRAKVRDRGDVAPRRKSVVRHRTVRNERSPVGEDCQAYGVQTRQRRRKNMATIEGRKSVAENRPGIKFQNGTQPRCAAWLRDTPLGRRYANTMTISQLPERRGAGVKGSNERK